MSCAHNTCIRPIRANNLCKWHLRASLPSVTLDPASTIFDSLPNRQKLGNKWPKWEEYKKNHSSEILHSSEEKVWRVYVQKVHQYSITLNTLFYLTYHRALEKLVYKTNPFLSLIPKNSNNLYNQPVIVGLEHGVTFNQDE